MNIRRARRRVFRCILKTVAVECENRNTNSSRSGGICSLAKLIIIDRTNQIRTVIGQCEPRARIERCRRIIHTIFLELIHPCGQTSNTNFVPVKVLHGIIIANHRIPGCDIGVQDKF